MDEFTKYIAGSQDNIQFRYIHPGKSTGILNNEIIQKEKARYIAFEALSRQLKEDDNPVIIEIEIKRTEGKKAGI